jgi:hypothetical protein
MRRLNHLNQWQDYKMATILARKSGPSDNAIATDDEHHEALAADPTINAFPQGSSFGGFGNATTGTSFGAPTFGAPQAGGFGSTSQNFGSTSGSFGTSPAVGGSSFGASPMGAGQPGSVQVVQNQGESLKNTGGAMQEGAENLVAHDKDSTDWINKKWRPVMGWVYMLTCTCDFVVFPILWSLLQALTHGNVTSQWQPLTLQGAGLYHIAMGAVLGIAAYGRTKEKVAGAA